MVATETKPAVTEYAESVLSGEIVAGPLVRLACERHLEDLRTGHLRGLRFDEDAAEKATSFFSFLRLAEGEFAGKTFILLPWQKFIIGSLFGWKGPDGYRRFRKAYIEAGKGSGKSPLLAGIGLLGLVADGEQGAEIYSAAVTRDQAGILFNDAKRMVKASEALSRRIDVGVSNLAYLAGGSYFRPVSSEGRSLDGKRVYMALIDEVHEHPTNIVVEKMQAGTKGRRQPLICEITNSGYDRQSVCWAHHEYSEKVLRGVIEDDGWFAYVCALDEGDDYRDPSVWLKSNPSLGVTIPTKYLEEQVREAAGMPAKESIVKRLNFCIWVQQASRWIDLGLWDENAGAGAVEAELVGRTCYGGLDLANVSDFNAWLLAFPHDDDPDEVDILCRFWCPESKLYDPHNRYAANYQAWANAGLIQTTPGDATDYGFIKAQILEDAGRFKLVDLNADRLFQGQGLCGELAEEGLKVFAMGQGFLSMAVPMKEFERRLRTKKLHHGGHPVLRWMADNMAVKQDAAGNLKPDKETSQGKIDGIVALVMALDRAMRRGEPKKSAYEDHGLMAV